MINSVPNYPNQPNMGNKISDELVNGFNNSPIGRSIGEDTSQKDQLLTTGLVLPVSIGLYKTLDGFAKSNAGPYEKSLVGRLANWGDKVSTGKLVTNPVSRTIGSVVNSITSRVKNFVNNSKILSSIVKTPSVAENQWVTSMTHGAKEEIAGEFTDFVGRFLKKNNLKTLSLTPAELSAVPSHIGGTAQINYAALQKLGLDSRKLAKLSAKPELIDRYMKMFGNKIAENSALSKLGMTSAEWQAISKNPAGNIDRLKQICTNVGSKYSITKDKLPLIGKLTKREITLEQIGNKLKALTEPTTGLGKFLPKAAIRGLHGITFGGGIFMLMSAFSLADAITKTKNAEKGDKFPTFMEGFLSNISWVITMPLGINFMNAIGGMANIGKSKAQVDAFRDALKIFNQNVKSGKYATKAAYDTARASVEALRNAGAKPGFLGKICKSIGKVLTIGRENILPFKNPNATTFAAKLGNFARKIPFNFKNFLSYPIGLAAYMLVFAPIVDKLFVKASHAIFGKPKNSIHDEPKANVQLTPEEKFNAYAGIQELPDSNLLKQYSNNTLNLHDIKPTNTVLPVNNAIPPNANPMYTQPVQQPINQMKTGPVRSYIPSSAPVVLNPAVTPDHLSQVLAKADRMEQEALKYL